MPLYIVVRKQLQAYVHRLAGSDIRMSHGKRMQASASEETVSQIPREK
jgi:hypothetical protein